MPTTLQNRQAEQDTNQKRQFEATLIILLIRWARKLSVEIVKGELVLIPHINSLQDILRSFELKVANAFKIKTLRRLNAVTLDDEILASLIIGIVEEQSSSSAAFVINTLQKKLNKLTPEEADLKKLSLLWLLDVIKHLRDTVSPTEVSGIAEHTKMITAFHVSVSLGIVLDHVWVTELDERVRLWHQEAQGQRVQVGDDFIVGPDKLRFPRDPKGSLVNIINCRCSAIVVRR